MDEVLAAEIEEDAPSYAFLSRSFVIQKSDYPRDCLVASLSVLNRFMIGRKFKMVTMAQAWLQL